MQENCDSMSVPRVAAYCSGKQNFPGMGVGLGWTMSFGSLHVSSSVHPHPIVATRPHRLREKIPH